ncbi:pro-sigmaK processing inhibitor BofA family protein [Bacillus tianshenii]|nr:pro-sigmaK processing inhibitor BofA family protein [Bacillus tianshenii]
MEPVIVFSILGGLILLLLILGAPIKPLQIIGQGCVKLIVGALLLFFLNAFGTSLGMHIPINFITAAISGFLGLPGLAALVAIEAIILI